MTPQGNEPPASTVLSIDAEEITRSVREGLLQSLRKARNEFLRNAEMIDKAITSLGGSEPNLTQGRNTTLSLVEDGELEGLKTYPAISIVMRRLYDKAGKTTIPLDELTNVLRKGKAPLLGKDAKKLPANEQVMRMKKNVSIALGNNRGKKEVAYDRKSGTATLLKIPK